MAVGGEGEAVMFRRAYFAIRRWLYRGPVRRLKHGDVVLPHEVIGLYSECVAEDGRILRLYDLVQGRTGAQAFRLGEAPGAITVAD
jgi:hypothetical protein